MGEHRELEQIGKGKSTRYRARVATTISIEKLREYSSHSAAVTIADKPLRTSPRGYIHTPGHFNAPGHVPGGPLKDQGGQGSGVKRVYVGSAG